jgi:hypothetical protein
VATNAVGQIARDMAAEPHVTPLRQPTAPSAPRPGSLIAVSLWELVRPSSRSASSTARFQRSPAIAEPEIGQMLTARPPQVRGAKEADDRLLDWKRPAMAVGGFVIAAGVIGAVAGLSVKGDEGSSQIEPATTVAVPSPVQFQKAAAALNAPRVASVDVHPPSPVRVGISNTRVRPAGHRRHRWKWTQFAKRSATKGPSVDPVTPAADSTAQPVAADLPQKM